MTRIVVAISGASGAVYGIRALELLRGMPTIETHLIVSPAARTTIGVETDLSSKEVAIVAIDLMSRIGIATMAITLS